MSSTDKLWVALVIRNNLKVAGEVKFEHMLVFTHAETREAAVHNIAHKEWGDERYGPRSTTSIVDIHCAEAEGVIDPRKYAPCKKVRRRRVRVESSSVEKRDSPATPRRWKRRQSV